MSSDSSSSPPPPPDSSSSSTSQSPPPPTRTPPPPPPPPPPPASSSPPPPSSSPPPPAPSKSGGKSSTPPPPSKDKNKSPPSDNDNTSSLRPKSRSSPPSPPSRSRNDHPKRNSPQLKDGSAKNNDSSNQAAIIAGVTAGAVLLLAVLIASMICCCRKKKRKKTNHELQYYRDSNHPHENMNNYYSNPTSGEYMVKIPPPPAPASAGVSSEFGWTPAPPPPPPHMNSSEMSSGGFSGPYQPALPPPHPAVALEFNRSSFTYEDLSAATGGFAAANLLGQGGFGFVHKGVLPNGKEIAVKSLKLNSGQGEREFHAEVDIISRVHHRHLVSLVGYCSTGSQRLLVYEFVDNGTLEQHLHGTGKPFLDWATRHQIALGASKGFAYLHEDCHPRIIHRDIKAANILIDSNCEAKVADFGLAKLSNDNLTHVSTRIMGTFGYLAPEYASSGKLTEKSDVYSFGVMLLELITGRRPINIHNNDDDSLVDWARPILMRVQEGGRYEELVDPRLGNNYDPDEMLHMVTCAAACIRHSARGRPKMSQIVRALEGDVSLDDLNNGPKITSTHMSSTGSDYDMRRFGKGALSSQDYSSSEEHAMDFQSRS